MVWLQMLSLSLLVLQMIYQRNVSRILRGSLFSCMIGQAHVHTNVDMACLQLFTQKNRSLDTIPLTRAALKEHPKRAVYQGGICWGKCMEVRPTLPSPLEWGWTNPDAWKLFWTTPDEANNSCRELIRCGCKQRCTGRCKCVKASLLCTALCLCGGDCDRD